MAFGLSKEQMQFIRRMIRSGRYKTQSEVVRDALRRMEEAEADYLRPPVLTDAQTERIYEPDAVAGERERRFGKAAFAAVRRRSARKSYSDVN
jgi:putative addiction module CopG family antidote